MYDATLNTVFSRLYCSPAQLLSCSGPKAAVAWFGIFLYFFIIQELTQEKTLIIYRLFGNKIKKWSYFE